MSFTGNKRRRGGGQPIAAAVDTDAIPSGSVVSGAITVVLTSHGAGAGSDALTSSYAYLWTGEGIDTGVQQTTPSP